MVILKALYWGTLIEKTHRQGVAVRRSVALRPCLSEKKRTKGEAANDQAASGDLLCAIVRSNQSSRNLWVVTNFAVCCGQSGIVHFCPLL
jgi:hypothetical protein